MKTARLKTTIAFLTITKPNGCFKGDLVWFTITGNREYSSYRVITACRR